MIPEIDATIPGAKSEIPDQLGPEFRYQALALLWISSWDLHSKMEADLEPSLCGRLPALALALYD